MLRVLGLFGLFCLALLPPGKLPEGGGCFEGSVDCWVSAGGSLAPLAAALRDLPSNNPFACSSLGLLPQPSLSDRPLFARPPPRRPQSQVQDNLGFKDDEQVVFTVTAPNAALQAKITEPQGFVVQNQNGNTTITLDGRDSVGLPGRPVQQYSWEITVLPRTNNQNFLVTAFGAIAQISLPVGQYNVTLKVSDGTGLSSTASQNLVIGAGRADGQGLIAVISLPNSWVPPPPPGGIATVTLDAAGTQPSPGNQLTQYVWAVISLPDKTPVTNTTGARATVQLPPGEYQVRGWVGGWVGGGWVGGWQGG